MCAGEWSVLHGLLLSPEKERSTDMKQTSGPRRQGAAGRQGSVPGGPERAGPRPAGSSGAVGGRVRGQGLHGAVTLPWDRRWWPRASLKCHWVVHLHKKINEPPAWLPRPLPEPPSVTLLLTPAPHSHPYPPAPQAGALPSAATEPGWPRPQEPGTPPVLGQISVPGGPEPAPSRSFLPQTPDTEGLEAMIHRKER